MMDVCEDRERSCPGLNRAGSLLYECVYIPLTNQIEREGGREGEGGERERQRERGGGREGMKKESQDP